MKLVVSSILAAVLLASAAQAQPAGDAERGKAAFLHYGCYTCHGYDAQGVPGRKLAPNFVGGVDLPAREDDVLRA